MKLNLMSCLLVAILCCACSHQKAVSSDASPSRTTVIANSFTRDTSPVTTEERKLGTFSKLSSHVPGKITVTIGSPASVKVTSNQNSLPKITTEVKGDTLIVKSEPVNVERLEVSIVVNKLDSAEVGGAASGTFKNMAKSGLESVKVSGASSVEMDVVESKTFDVTVSGASKLTARGKSDNLNIVVSGGSGAILKDLKTENCTVNISGASMGSSQVVNKVSGTVTGASGLTLSGKPRVNEVVASGASGVTVQ